MSIRFHQIQLADGIHLHVLPTDKFKTVSIFVFLHMPLSEQTITANALLPMVLMRGTASYPTTSALVRHLDELYGASLNYSVARRGEVHSLLFRLEVPAETYLSDAGGLLNRALDTLAEAIFRPHREGQALAANYTAQEKDNLKEFIASLINDKRRYALSRCREEMCVQEPFALYHLGRISDLASITPATLHDHWQSILRTAAVDIAVVGDVELTAIAEGIRRRFSFPGGGTRTVPPTQVKRTADGLRQVQDQQPVNQGVLVLGFRTGTVMRDPEFFPMVVANGILGGYAHSKLFTNVREEHSLAYYAYSGIETIKGIGFMYAGIEFANYEQCLEIILKQVQDLQHGVISDAEMDATIRALVSDSLAAVDSPGRMVEELIAGRIGGRVLTVEERVAAYQSVTRDQVAAAAARFTPELVYFLTKAGEGDSGASSA